MGQSVKSQRNSAADKDGLTGLWSAATARSAGYTSDGQSQRTATFLHSAVYLAPPGIITLMSSLAVA